jgi:uncharacterized membrane protein YedE/YeeE
MNNDRCTPLLHLLLIVDFVFVAACSSLKHGTPSQILLCVVLLPTVLLALLLYFGAVVTLACSDTLYRVDMGWVGVSLACPLFSPFVYDGGTQLKHVRVFRSVCRGLCIVFLWGGWMVSGVGTTNCYVVL